MQLFVDENKQCALFINKLKDEIKNLNLKSSKYIKDKEQILTQIRYLSDENERLHKDNESLQCKIKNYEACNVICRQICPVHGRVCTSPDMLWNYY